MNKQLTTILALDIAIRVGWAARTLGGGARDPDHVVATSDAETAELMLGVAIAASQPWWPSTAADSKTGSPGSHWAGRRAPGGLEAALRSLRRPTMTTTSPRRRRPNRRPNMTREIEVDGERYTVTMGLYPEGDIGEVFIAGPKIGSDLDAALQDAAILASLALQYGTPPAALATSMSRQPISTWELATAPASPVGAAMDLIARLDRAKE